MLARNIYIMDITGNTNDLNHIAFIMDGNGRWAKNHGMPREYGHKEGAAVFKRTIEYCGSIGINTVTVYTLSTENYIKRPKNEIEAIMKLFTEYLYDALSSMTEKNIKVMFLGDRSVLSPSIVRLMDRVESESADNKLLLNIAINYGSRAEIVMAVNKLINSGMTHVSEDDITANLYTAHCQPPDLIVRTGAEKRLSNFLLWQSAYSELYFTDVLWPDFSFDDVDKAVNFYCSHERRYGGV